jgi:hypothetical protein
VKRESCYDFRSKFVLFSCFCFKGVPSLFFNTIFPVVEPNANFPKSHFLSRFKKMFFGKMTFGCLNFRYYYVGRPCARQYFSLNLSYILFLMLFSVGTTI